jgi:hypothetical protein
MAPILHQLIIKQRQREREKIIRKREGKEYYIKLKKVFLKGREMSLLQKKKRKII